MDLKATYNKIADDWFRDHNSDDWWVEETNYLASLLPPRAKVLDIGCGAGHKTSFLLKKGFEVVGADFSESMLKIAKRENPHATFRLVDLYEIGSLGEKFDCIFAQAVFLHIPKKEVVDILKNSKPILSKGGLFYIAVKGVLPGHPEEQVETKDDYGYEYQRFFSYFTVSEVHDYFEQAGFSVVHSNVGMFGKTQWIQVTAKL